VLVPISPLVFVAVNPASRAMRTMSFNDRSPAAYHLKKLLATIDSMPVAARAIDVRLVWLSEQPYDSDASYLVRSVTDLVPAGLNIEAHLDLETMAQTPTTGCAVNDIALVRINLGRPTAFDEFDNFRRTGSFVLVDAVSGATVAGGVVTKVHFAKASTADTMFELTRDVLANGLCSDLKDNTADRAERSHPRLQTVTYAAGACDTGTDAGLDCLARCAVTLSAWCRGLFAGPECRR
jgi:hypothetical protein